MSDSDGVGDASSAGSATGPGALGLAPSSAAATIGMLGAAVALVTVILPGEGGDATAFGLPIALVVRTAAVGGVLVFVLRRRGLIPPKTGLLATAASLVVLGGDILTMVDAVSVWPQPLGVPLAGVASFVAATYGVVDASGQTDDAVVRGTYGLAAAVGIGFAGFLTANVAALLGMLAVGPSVDIVPGLTTIGSRYVVITATSAIGFGLFTYGTLRVMDIDPRAYIDIRRPTLRELGVALAGVVVLILLNAGANWLIQEFSLPFAPSQIETSARGEASPTFLLYLIPLSWVATAPGEELVYRNLVQKYLYGPLGRWGAVLSASAIFAIIHGSQYANEAPAATLVSLGLVFALALVLGITYEYTDNLTVPILVHGTFNAYSFVLMYLSVTGGPTPGVG